MPNFVRPKVFHTGTTAMVVGGSTGIRAYLKHVEAEEFWNDIVAAKQQGISDGEILCSLYAKLCYKSLVVGKNDNISKTRSIKENLKSCYSTAHGSVFEHCNLNFLVTGCSRVYTHEQVRHRVGVAYSQTSGRYVKSVPMDFVEDGIIGEKALAVGRELLAVIEKYYGQMVEASGLEDMSNFDQKKKITSALRRYLPNGQANEIGITLNIRTLRHCIQVRTSRHAEREIREIYGQVYDILAEAYPLIVADAQVREVDGLKEIYGMRMQPYDLTVDGALGLASDYQLASEIEKRSTA